MKTRRTLALLSSAAVAVGSVSSSAAPEAIIPSTENSVRGASASDGGQLVVAPPPSIAEGEVALVAHPELLASDDNEGDSSQRHRKLSWCWDATSGPPPQKWHPQYDQGWTAGFCKFEFDCDSPGYATELACCKGAYAGQVSGACLASLPNPPTSSPTATGGLDVFYPDYDMAWTDAECINTRPLPSGRPTYDTMLACCKGAYAGQLSGELKKYCLSSVCLLMFCYCCYGFLTHSFFFHSRFKF